MKYFCNFFFQYLEAVRDLPGFQTIAFLPCTCSIRNDGFVIPKITYDCLELSACSPNGIPEVYNFFGHFEFPANFSKNYVLKNYMKFVLQIAEYYRYV